MSDRLGMLLVGVGGQGVLTAARILGDAAHRSGHEVVVGQLHGMSQRGGSVQCTVLIGPGESSFIRRVDVLLGFEPLEALRARDRLTAATKGLVNEGRVELSEWSRRQWPDIPLDRMLGDIRGAAPDVTPVNASHLAAQAGDVRTLNICLLGALAGLGLLPFDEKVLWEAAARRCSPLSLEANRRAFDLGWAETGSAPSSVADAPGTTNPAESR